MVHYLQKYGITSATKDITRLLYRSKLLGYLLRVPSSRTIGIEISEAWSVSGKANNPGNSAFLFSSVSNPVDKAVLRINLNKAEGTRYCCCCSLFGD